MDDVEGLLRARRSPSAGMSAAMKSAAIPFSLLSLLGLTVLLVNLGQYRDPPSRPEEQPVSPLFVALTCLAIGVIFSVLIYWGQRRKGFAEIVPQYRRHRRGLSAQARSNWAVGITVFVLTSLVAVLVGYWQIRSQR